MASTGNPGMHEVSAGVEVVDVSDPSALALLADDGDDPVVLVSHPSTAHAAAVAATFLVSHRPGRRVARLRSTHAPLAVLVALARTRELASDAGHAAAVLHDLLSSTWSAVVLGSVAGLPHPNPPLSQHLRSFLPGSRFLVRLGDEAVSVRADRSAPALTGLGRGDCDLYVTESGADDELVRELSRTLAPVSVRELALPGTWSSLYGRAEQLQLALVPEQVRDLLSPAGPECRGCGLSAAGPVCPFCRTRTRTGSEAEPATAQPSTTPDAQVSDHHPTGRTT